jgi:hypothetical protein
MMKLLLLYYPVLFVLMHFGIIRHGGGDDRNAATGFYFVIAFAARLVYGVCVLLEEAFE